MGNQAKVGVTVLAVLASLVLARAPGLAQVRFQQRQRLRPLDYSRLAPMLGFEMRPRANIPGGWTGGPTGTIFADSQVVHSGHWSVRLERKSASRQN